MSGFDGLVGKRLFDATAAELGDLVDAFAYDNKKKRPASMGAFAKSKGMSQAEVEAAILAARLAQGLPLPANFGAPPPPPLPPRPSRGAPPIPPRPGAPIKVSALGGSNAVKMQNPGICMRQAELQEQKKRAFQDISKNMREEMRALNGIPEGLTCARSQTTQAKLAIRGVASVVAKDTPACGLRDMVDKQARAAASASASNLYRRNLAQAGVPLNLRCKRRVAATRGATRFA